MGCKRSESHKACNVTKSCTDHAYGVQHPINSIQLSESRWQNGFRQNQLGCLPGALSTSGCVLINAGIVWWSLFCRVSTSSRNACWTHSASTFWASALIAAMSTSQLKKCSNSDELAIHTATARASPLAFYSKHTAQHHHHHTKQIHLKLIKQWLQWWYRTVNKTNSFWRKNVIN